MPTIRELLNLKRRIDGACNEIGSKAYDKGKQLSTDPEVTVKVCYHNHYDVTTFSIWTWGMRENLPTSVEGVQFLVEDGTPTEIVEELQAFVLKHLDDEV